MLVLSKLSGSRRARVSVKISAKKSCALQNSIQMFSEGQLIFAAIALVLFFILMFFSYRSDRKRNRKYFKNSYIVLIVFLLFMGFLFFLKVYFHK